MQCISVSVYLHLHSTDQGTVVTGQEGGSLKWGVLRKQSQGAGGVSHIFLCTKMMAGQGLEIWQDRLPEDARICLKTYLRVKTISVQCIALCLYQKTRFGGVFFSGINACCLGM